MARHNAEETEPRPRGSGFLRAGYCHSPETTLLRSNTHPIPVPPSTDAINQVLPIGAEKEGADLFGQVGSSGHPLSGLGIEYFQFGLVGLFPDIELTV